MALNDKKTWDELQTLTNLPYRSDTQHTLSPNRDQLYAREMEQMAENRRKVIQERDELRRLLSQMLHGEHSSLGPWCGGRCDDCQEAIEALLLLNRKTEPAVETAGQRVSDHQFDTWRSYNWDHSSANPFYKRLIKDTSDG